MPGSPTTPGQLNARDIAFIRIAFRQRNNVGTRNEGTFAAQWLACVLPQNDATAREECAFQATSAGVRPDDA